MNTLEFDTLCFSLEKALQSWPGVCVSLCNGIYRDEHFVYARRILTVVVRTECSDCRGGGGGRGRHVGDTVVRPLSLCGVNLFFDTNCTRSYTYSVRQQPSRTGRVGPIVLWRILIVYHLLIREVIGVRGHRGQTCHLRHPARDHPLNTYSYKNK